MKTATKKKPVKKMILKTKSCDNCKATFVVEKKDQEICNPCLKEIKEVEEEE